MAVSGCIVIALSLLCIVTEVLLHFVIGSSGNVFDAEI